MAHKKPENVAGLIDNEDGGVLEHYASKVEPGHCIIEIGPFTGKSTAFMARGMHDEVKLFTIDPWDMLDVPVSGTGLTIAVDRKAAEAIFKTNMKKCGIEKKVTPVKAFSGDAARKWAGAYEIGLIYIDGNHKYPGVKADIEDWLPKLRVGGVAIFDDYHSAQGVRRAVNEFSDGNPNWVRLDNDEETERFVIMRREM